MRAMRVFLLVAAAIAAAVHADSIESSVLDGSASSLSIGGATAAPLTTAPSTTETTATTASSVSTPSSEEEATAASSASASSSEKEATAAPEADGFSSGDASVAASVVAPDTSSASISTSSPAATTTAPTRPSASSSDSIGTLADTSSTISGSVKLGLSPSGMFGIAFGALACVGAIVLVVTHKKRSDRDSDNQPGPPSSCAYADGTFFTPDSRSLDAILDLEKPSSSGQLQHRPSEKLVPVLSMADLTGLSVVRASSPFGLNNKTVRVSSPVRQFSSNCSEDDMVFVTSSRQPQESTDLVLSFADLERASSASTVAAIEDGSGQVLL